MKENRQQLEPFELDLSNIKKASKMESSGKSSMGKGQKEPPKATPSDAANKSQTEPPKKSKVGGKKLFNWEVHQDLKSKFGDLSKHVMISTEDFSFGKKDFFELCINYYSEALEGKGQLMNAPDKFTKYIQRSGKRPFNERYPRGSDKIRLVLELNNDTYQRYLDLIYSEAVLKNDVYNENLSTKYYLYDLIDRAEKDIEQLTKHYETL